VDALGLLATDIAAAIAKRDGRKEGAEIRFLCPAHDDEHPSARWNPKKRVWHCDVCGAGSGAVDLARRLGLEIPQEEDDGLTLEGLAEARGLSVSFLRNLGVQTGVAGQLRQSCVDVPYCNEAGEAVAVRKRLHLDREPRFIWRRGDHPLPYGLTRLAEARGAGYVLLVEGESDSWACWQAGVPALGIPGAATWQPAWIRYLQGIPRVCIWREADAGGDTLAAKLALNFPDILIVDPPAGVKDPAALWQALDRDPGAFRQRLGVLIGMARRASDLRAEALGEEAREAWKLAQPVLEAPNLLDNVATAIRTGGYAGELTAPLLAYLALTSRLLGRPLNLAFIAPSAAGKNRAIDGALALMPPTAYYLEKAGSARALVYGDADYQHRTVIVAEADSIPEDGPAASAIRALAADNCMTYDVVERDAETGRFTTRHIEKPGPTGLITTATKSLGEQMGTRLLTVAVSDTPQQTRAVLQSHAATVRGASPKADVAALIAAQRWLELAGDHNATIPFASVLADAVPADLVRMRRDFRQLLTVIQAVALLYQRQRQRDAEGRIVATLEDYRRARNLLLESFTEAATGGVSGPVRETVQEVARLYDGTSPLTVKAVADGLGLSKDTVWHRVRRALRAGYVVNLEAQKGRPAKLVPGDPLPEERPTLPEPEELCVYAPHADGHSTVQPPDAGPICAESEAAVESAVEQPIQPPERAAPDTEPAPVGDAVERLNGDRGDKETHTESELAETRCPVCGSTEWWYRADGTGPVCGVCHPNPAVLAGDRL